MNTHNIGFNEDLTKIVFQLSSKTHLTSSSELYGETASKITTNCMEANLTAFKTANCMEAN